MFKITMKLKGIENIKKMLERKGRTFETIPLIMLEEVELAVAMARYACPISDIPKDVHMVDTIQIGEIDFAEMRIVAGVYAMNEKGVHYPWFVEFGTVKMHARPFWRPPIWNAFFRIRERIQTGEA